jgi:plastocyanin
MRRILHLTALAVGVLAVSAPPAAAGGGCHGDQTEGAGSTVEMKGMCFTPTALHVEPGTEVGFVNRDPLVHVVVGVGWGAGNELRTGESTTHRFADEGAFPYTCNLHPGMSGVVLVGDSDAPLTADPISTTREESSAAKPALFGAGVVVVAAAAVAGRLTAKRSSTEPSPASPGRAR